MWLVAQDGSLVNLDAVMSVRVRPGLTDLGEPDGQHELLATQHDGRTLLLAGGTEDRMRDLLNILTAVMASASELAMALDDEDGGLP